MRIVTTALVSLLVLVGDAGAELKVRGTGTKRVLVKEQFTGVTLARYDLFANRCTKCHAQGRIIDSLDWGTTPITGVPFDEPAIRTYVVKMMRKAKSGISKKDARELTEFLLDARRLANPDGDAPSPGPTSQPQEPRR